MSNTFVSGVVDGGNDPWWGQTKDYEIGIFCFFAKCGAKNSNYIVFGMIHGGVRPKTAKTGWIGVRIICPKGTSTCEQLLR
jgi:hypothetical protein